MSDFDRFTCALDSAKVKYKLVFEADQSITLELENQPKVQSTYEMVMHFTAEGALIQISSTF